MSRFNQPVQKTKTENLAGGQAYTQTPEMELISLLLTSFANDQYYEKAQNKFDRLDALLPRVAPEFAAKAIVYARNEFGMRSISHVAAVKLSSLVKGHEWAKDFYKTVIHRPDDITEILSFAGGKKGLTHAMIKGLAKSFDKFDAYQLAKYKGEGKGFSLVDAVNILHPTPVERNADALAKLVKGELKSTDTWEAKLSSAGQNAETEEQKEELKAEAWKDLIQSKRIGYFALLRNLRNIKESAPEVLDEALELLVNESMIRKSLVLPFRFLTALEQFESINGSQKIVMALNKAIDISCSNVPKFEGRSLVVVDYSWSMGDGYQSHKYKGSLFGSVFAKANACDFMIFGDNAAYVNYNPSDSVLTITKGFVVNNNGRGGVNVGHGTNFHSIFQAAKQGYERIVIFSDMQGWMGYNSPVKAFNEYKAKFGVNPFVYSFDLAGHGSMQFPESNVFALAGFSEKVFDCMKLMEEDKKALINKIKAITLT